MFWFWDFIAMGSMIASNGSIAHWHAYVKPCSRPLMATVYRHWELCVNRCMVLIKYNGLLDTLCM